MKIPSFFFNSKKLARLRAEAARVDADFEKQERHASAELRAIQMRNAIDSSKRVLARFSIEVPRRTEQ